ncbi:MAG: hypothetical protein ACRDJN_00645, partial [Chloroflexota bacterium]
MGHATDGHPLSNFLWRASVYSSFPYIRMTEQLAGQAVRVLAAPVAEVGRMLAAGAHRDPDAFRKAFAKWTLGTAVWGIAIDQTNRGNLAGVGTGSYQEEALARNARDERGLPIRQSEAMRLGGRWVPADFAGPWGMAAADVASAVEGWQDPGPAGKPPPDTWKRLTNALNNLGRQLNRQFYLEDFVRLANAVGEGRGVQELGRTAQGLTARAVPGLLRPLTEGIDPVVREPTNALEAVAARVPGRSATVPPKIDPTTGRPVGRGRADWQSVLLRSPAPGTPNPVAA